LEHSNVKEGEEAQGKASRVNALKKAMGGGGKYEGGIAKGKTAREGIWGILEGKHGAAKGGVTEAGEIRQPENIIAG